MTWPRFQSGQARQKPVFTNPIIYLDLFKKKTIRTQEEHSPFSPDREKMFLSQLTLLFKKFFFAHRKEEKKQKNFFLAIFHGCHLSAISRQPAPPRSPQHSVSFVANIYNMLILQNFLCTQQKQAPDGAFSV